MLPPPSRLVLNSSMPEIEADPETSPGFVSWALAAAAAQSASAATHAHDRLRSTAGRARAMSYSMVRVVLRRLECCIGDLCAKYETIAAIVRLQNDAFS